MSNDHKACVQWQVLMHRCSTRLRVCKHQKAAARAVLKSLPRVTPRAEEYWQQKAKLLKVAARCSFFAQMKARLDDVARSVWEDVVLGKGCERLEAEVDTIETEETEHEALGAECQI